MGTEIFQFGPGKAKKNKIENFILHSKILFDLGAFWDQDLDQGLTIR